MDGIKNIIIVYILIVIFSLFGYVINVVKLIKLDFQEPYKAEIIRGVGLIPPLGGVIGWLNIKD